MQPLFVLFRALSESFTTISHYQKSRLSKSFIFCQIQCHFQSWRRATTFDNLSYNNFLPSDSHHKSQLGFIRDIEVAILPGLSCHTNVISFLSSVFFDIFLCSSEDDFPLFLLFLKWTTVYIQLKFIIYPDDL